MDFLSLLSLLNTIHYEYILAIVADLNNIKPDGKIRELHACLCLPEDTSMLPLAFTGWADMAGADPAMTLGAP